MATIVKEVVPTEVRRELPVLPHAQGPRTTGDAQPGVSGRDTDLRKGYAVTIEIVGWLPGGAL